MIDQEESPTTREPSLTPEQIAKSDKDIATLSSLTSFANSIESQLEVTGGYAVEAHFDGRISRPHADMDTVLWLGSTNLESEAQQGIRDLLRNESTAWREYFDEIKKDHFIEFREDAPDKTFEERRRLELYAFDRDDKRRLQKKTLVSSNGQQVDIWVSSLETVVADKVRIMNRTQEEIKRRGLRQTNERDRSDLKRLISHAELDQGKSLHILAQMIFERAHGRLTQKEAEQQAKIMWNTAVKLIHSQQGSL